MTINLSINDIKGQNWSFVLSSPSTLFYGDAFLNKCLNSARYYMVWNKLDLLLCCEVGAEKNKRKECHWYRKKKKNFVKHKQAIKKQNGLVLFIKAFTCSYIY